MFFLPHTTSLLQATALANIGTRLHSSCSLYLTTNWIQGIFDPQKLTVSNHEMDGVSYQ